ncbi:Hypothetical_protein [Hexamita inflata]|uniref:Hypothetical_protein n=1 Tax=Hexamita inflata TaxID=28002 RepID=A0AA86PHA6_9EUKA|nr:Hypothetical protein HINF_LOCUS26188 [Hexamita inflata]
MSLSYSSGVIALFDNLWLIDPFQIISANNVVISLCEISSVSKQVAWVGGISAIIQNVSANITNIYMQNIIVRSISNISSFGGIFGKSLDSKSIISNLQYENNVLIAEIQNFVHVGNIIGYANSSNLDIIGSFIKNTNISININNYSIIGGLCGFVQISNISIMRTKICDIDIHSIGGNLTYTGAFVGQIINNIFNTVIITSFHVDSIYMFSSSIFIYQHMIVQSNVNINTKINVYKSYSSGFSFMNDVSITNCPLFLVNSTIIGC